MNTFRSHLNFKTQKPSFFASDSELTFKLISLHEIFEKVRAETIKKQKGLKLKRTQRNAKDFFAYPVEDSLNESCDNGGTGEPPLSSDGVLDKNKLPPISETKVMGEL